MKYLYLLFGLSGATGAILITVKVIHLTFISNIGMVLVFGAACLCLTFMMLGFFGYSQMRYPLSDEAKKLRATKKYLHECKKYQL